MKTRTGILGVLRQCRRLLFCQEFGLLQMMSYILQGAVENFKEEFDHFGLGGGLVPPSQG